MSYWLEDRSGRWLGDFATASGALELLRDGATPEPLREFLKVGKADSRLTQAIVLATRPLPDLRYIARMLSKASPPVVLCDGANSVVNESVIELTGGFAAQISAALSHRGPPRPPARSPTGGKQKHRQLRKRSRT